MRLQNIRYIVQIVYILLLTTTFFISLKYFLLIILISTIIGGSFFCGWLCPFGTMQEMINNLSKLFKIPQIKINFKFHKYFVFSRYIIYILMITSILTLFAFDARISFLDLLMGEKISLISYIFLVFFIIISFFSNRFFCNYFCIQGARYGLYSAFRVFRIKRDEKSCKKCKICDKNCPMNIKISESKYVNSLQCINCFNCINNCPKQNTLKYSFIDIKDIKNIKIKNIKK